MKQKKGSDVKFSVNEKKILYALIDNAKTSDHQLARTIGISQPAVFKIRKKLENKGAITKYSAQVDYQKIGINAICIFTGKRPKNIPPEKQAEFYKKLRKLGNCASLICTPSIIMIKCLFRNKEEAYACYTLNKEFFNDFFENVKMNCLTPAQYINFEDSRLFRKIINHEHYNNSHVKKLKKRNNKKIS